MASSAGGDAKKQKPKPKKDDPPPIRYEWTPEEKAEVPEVTPEALRLCDTIEEEDKCQKFVLLQHNIDIGAIEKKEGSKVDAPSPDTILISPYCCQVTTNKGFTEYRSIQIQGHLQKLKENQRLIICRAASGNKASGAVLYRYHVVA